MLKASTKGKFYAQGLNFSCKRCSACCRFEAGYVFLSRKDASLLCAALSMDYDSFLKTYCRWVPEKSGSQQLSLKEKSNYDCVFWNSRQSDGSLVNQGCFVDEGCFVYEARPLQCRTFPFWPSIMRSKHNWKMTAEDCPGMNQGALHSEDSIREMLSMRQAEPIISKNV